VVLDKPLPQEGSVNDGLKAALPLVSRISALARSETTSARTANTIDIWQRNIFSTFPVKVLGSDFG
jgi:hypothetical protein